MNIVNFYYFTGTGNTLLVIYKMKEVFEKNGIKVNLYKMEKVSPSKIDTSHTIGIGFPVAMQGTYPFVWKFVEDMPNANGTPIFMVDTLHSFSGGVVGPMRNILRRKGYKTIGAKEIKMPSNLLRKKINKEKDRERIKKGLKEAEIYATALINGDAHWGYTPFFSDLLSLLSKKDGLWNFFGKFYKLDTDKNKCTKCGICEKICPINNISLPDYPLHGNICYFCMRCVAFCPENAIYIVGKKTVPYRAVELKDILQ